MPTQRLRRSEARSPEPARPAPITARSKRGIVTDQIASAETPDLPGSGPSGFADLLANQGLADNGSLRFLKDEELLGQLPDGDDVVAVIKFSVCRFNAELLLHGQGDVVHCRG